MSLWEDVVVDGKHSLESHELKLVKKWCPQDHHLFEITGNRSLKCKKCGQEITYVLGKQQVIGGKLVDSKEK